MQRLRGLVAVLAVVGLMVGLSARSFAGPLLPPLPATPGLPGVAGESKLANLTTAGDFIRIDWIVQDAAPFGYPGSFAYLYQIENTTGLGEGIRSFNVAFGPMPGTLAGVLGGDNLDLAAAFHFAHTSAIFPNLGAPPPPAETEPLPGILQPTLSAQYGVLITSTKVSWNIIAVPGGVTPEIPPGRQSVTLFIIDPRPPMYGKGVAINAGTAWLTGPTAVPGQFGDPVPVPSPEPATLVLFSLGMGLIGFVLRRSR